jgi:hypothetical protein
MDQHRLNRIRFLSRRFNELKGLRVAFTGLCIAAGLGSYLALAARPTDNGAIVALLVSFVPVVPGMSWLNRYYTSTFGRQVSAPAPKWPVLLMVPVFWFMVYLNARFPSIPAGAPTLVVVAVASAVVAIRDWPWRGYYFVATAAVTCSFAASASGAGVLGPGKTVGAMFIAVGVSMVPIGLLDHLMLVRLVKEARESQSVSPITML